jgi:hypothetical protein
MQLRLRDKSPARDRSAKRNRIKTVASPSFFFHARNQSHVQRPTREFPLSVKKAPAPQKREQR